MLSILSSNRPREPLTKRINSINDRLLQGPILHIEHARSFGAVLLVEFAVIDSTSIAFWSIGYAGIAQRVVYTPGVDLRIIPMQYSAAIGV